MKLEKSVKKQNKQCDGEIKRITGGIDQHCNYFLNCIRYIKVGQNEKKL